MGTKYSTVTISGYNSSAPSDDGSTTEANKVKWSTIKTKLNDPVKTAVESINTALVTALDQSAAAKTSGYSVQASDHDKTIEVTAAASSAVTVTLGDAATMGAGYVVRVSNQQTNYNVTVARSGSDTINGGTSFTVTPKNAASFIVNAAANGYVADACLLASAATTLAGTSTSEALTPAGFAGNKSLAASGYYKFPGGLMIQWGTVATDANGDATWTFPTTFSTACAGVYGVDRNGDTSRVVTTGTPTTSSCAIYICDSNTTSGINSTASVFAIGY